MMAGSPQVGAQGLRIMSIEYLDSAFVADLSQQIATFVCRGYRSDDRVLIAKPV